MLPVGSMAPDFHARLSDGTFFHLYEVLTIAPVVLYFYPKDFTSGCTLEAKLFRDGFGDLTRLNARIIGVSRDSDESHTEFRSACALPFPLLSDRTRNVSRLYDAEWPGGIGTMRVTYIIDCRRTIRGVLHYEVRIRKHVEATLDILKAIHDEDHH